MPHRHHRRSAAVGLAVAALAAGALAATPTASAVQAADPSSPLVLTAPDAIKVRSHHGWVYSDFGAQLVAQNSDFEIHAKRPTYDDPISATWVQKDSTGAVVAEVPLPEGSMTTWRGLDAFTKVVIRREGRRLPVDKQEMPGCLNTWRAEPVLPDHSAGNDYPWGCPWNPFTVGSVMGVSKGFGVSALGDYGYYSRKLEPGTYTVTVKVLPHWRDVFGISDADGEVTRPLTVRKARTRNGFGRPTQRTGAPAHEPNLQLEQGSTTAPAAESAGAMVNEFAPDLRSLPAFGAQMNRKGTAIRFGATIWNGGNGPMVVEGFEPETPSTDPADRHLDAYQYYFDGNGEITGHDLVGEFHFHEGNHNHWHFEDFGRYQLLEDDAGVPGDVAVRSTKASFCLANTDAVDYTLPHAEWRPENTDLSSACGGRRATYLREVLSAGSGDTYYQFRTGQAFRVGNLEDGDYWISVEANPADDPAGVNEGRNLVELDYTNNDSVRKITLKTNKRTGVRRVTMAPVGIIDEQWGFRSAR